jgi:hypothetical protein
MVIHELPLSPIKSPASGNWAPLFSVPGRRSAPRTRSRLLRHVAGARAAACPGTIPTLLCEIDTEAIYLWTPRLARAVAVYIKPRAAAQGGGASSVRLLTPLATIYVTMKCALVELLLTTSCSVVASVHESPAL